MDLQKHEAVIGLVGAGVAGAVIGVLGILTARHLVEVGDILAFVGSLLGILGAGLVGVYLEQRKARSDALRARMIAVHSIFDLWTRFGEYIGGDDLAAPKVKGDWREQAVVDAVSAHRRWLLEAEVTLNEVRPLLGAADAVTIQSLTDVRRSLVTSEDYAKRALAVLRMDHPDSHEMAIVNINLASQPIKIAAGNALNELGAGNLVEREN